MPYVPRLLLVATLAVAGSLLLPADLAIAQGQFQGGQQRDADFDTTVAEPAYSSTHPVVFIDEAHNNFHTAAGRYRPFADLMASDGYQVEPNQKVFNSHLLSRCQVLVIANAMSPGIRSMPHHGRSAPHHRPPISHRGEPLMGGGSFGSAFTPEECKAVEHWVRRGGSLLLISDHPPFGTAAAPLAAAFGVEMSQAVTVDPANETDGGLLFARDAGHLGDHPILTGRDDAERIDRVLTFTGQSLQGPADSTALLKLADTAVDRGMGGLVSAAGRSQGLALRHGKGRVMVMGEAADLSAQVAGFPPKKFGMNVPGCDNRQLALNIMHWLNGLME